MFKLLLCWRYLRTRYIALASVISVTLGVGTMIVVNSVMAGFAREMENRIHGVLADLSLEARDFNGARDAEWHMDQIRRIAGDAIEAMTPTVVVPALLNFDCGGTPVTRQVLLVGIDEHSQSQVSDFGKYLQHPANREAMSFDLRSSGYDVRDHQAGPEAPERPQMADAGWSHRRRVAETRAFQEHFLQQQREIREKQLHQRQLQEQKLQATEAVPGESQQPASSPATPSATAAASDPFGGQPTVAAQDPFAGQTPIAAGNIFDPARQQHDGAVIGIALGTWRTPEGDDRFMLLPGDDVTLACPTVGSSPQVTRSQFTVVDLYESKMSEYDSQFVFVPIRKLQEMRGMIDPTTHVGNFNTIQIRLKPGVDGDAVRDRLAAASAFPPELYVVSTWRDKQSALLAAVHMETAILNVLLFLIVAVAGFGILAIFYMIVVEKTRDIGILKSLGASGRGVMGIFLSYGFSLGLVGSGAGLAGGLLFVHYINEIADLLGKVTGQKVFDPSIYYFYSIPTEVKLTTVMGIVIGALLIAVAASVLPARRAALLHPVEALRYE